MSNNRRMKMHAAREMICSFVPFRSYVFSILVKNPTSEVHKGFFTYQCHMCHYGSNYKESLRAHLNLIHKQSEAEIATVHGIRKKAKKPEKPNHKQQVNSIQPQKYGFEEELIENVTIHTH